MNESEEIKFKKILKETFFTDRLILKNLTTNDFSFIKQLVNTNGWLEFIGDRNIHTDKDATNYISKINENPHVHYFKVSLKISVEPIGIITLIKRDYLEDYDIGFAFLPNFSNQGYAFEATKVIIENVIDFTKNKSLYAITVPKNISSIKLLNKLGLNPLETICREGEELLVYCISQDKFKIDTITNSFYHIFNNKDKKSPNEEIIHRLCIPQITIIKKMGIHQEIYTLNTFIKPRLKILTDGTLTEFEEFEIENNTTFIGNIAQRHSLFQKRGYLNGIAFNQKGNKFFQYLKTNDGWKINSIIWEDI